MTRAVVFLTATLLFASLGAVAQNNSPGAGGSASVQAPTPARNAQPAVPSGATVAGSEATTGASNQGIEAPTKNGSPQDSSKKDRQDPRAGAELPQTSTILPLLGLLGLGSLVAGLFARR